MREEPTTLTTSEWRTRERVSPRLEVSPGKRDRWADPAGTGSHCTEAEGGHTLLVARKPNCTQGSRLCRNDIPGQ